MIIIKITKSIKFYLDNTVNQVKKDKIIKFLTECQTVENQMLEHYWEHFDIVLKSKSNIDFGYNNTFIMIEPKLKSHHRRQVLDQTYEQMKSMQVKIIKRIHFKFENKEIQRIYNYCAKFVFNWEFMVIYIDKQIKKYKKDKSNQSYYDFLLNIQEYILNKDNFNQLKSDIENKFYEVKSKISCPIKKNLQIRCNTAHTVDVEKLNYYQWIFTIDNNDRIGGTDRKGIFDKLYIPIKFSEYHRKILSGKQLKNTFNLRVNKYGKVEIIACYETDINYPEYNNKETIGIDIGLKNLIYSSDNQVIEQNQSIVKLAKRLKSKKSNRDSLEKHLQKKYHDESFVLCNKNYTNMELRLSQFVKCDNRFKVKQFLLNNTDKHIVMENLELSSSSTYHKETNYLMKRMHIQQIKNDMIKYAKEFGVKISQVNPAFTSQQCPKCGYVSRKNRVSQEKFSCVKCNHEDNADHNASINIENRLNDSRIGLKTPIWKVKQILMIDMES